MRPFGKGADIVFEKNHKPLNFRQTWSVWLGVKRGLCKKTVYLATSISDECLVENQIASEIPNITSGCYGGAVSIGHRNTLAEPLGRCFIFEGLSRTLVEGSCYRI